MLIVVWSGRKVSDLLYRLLACDSDNLTIIRVHNITQRVEQGLNDVIYIRRL